MTERIGLPAASIKVGAAWALGMFIVTGTVSVLLPNTLFARMTPIAWWDYVLWPTSALLVGAFMAVHDATKRTAVACSSTAGMGGVTAFLGFACPQCNHLLVALMGTGGVLTFVEPYRLHIGLTGLMILALALGFMVRSYRRATRLRQTL